VAAKLVVVSSNPNFGPQFLMLCEDSQTTLVVRGRGKPWVRVIPKQKKHLYNMRPSPAVIST
jgi:hypothetical protein